MKVRHVNHLGINVNDLEAAKNFFVGLGFTLAGEFKMHGELLDEVTGLKDARTECFMLEAPDGQFNLEIIKYHHPVAPKVSGTEAPNVLGMQHIAFEVDDLDSILEDLRQKGHGLVGSVQNYENVYKLCYVRGPEGIIVELAEDLRK